MAKDTWKIISTSESISNGYTAVVDFTVKNKTVIDNIRLMNHMTLDEIEAYMDHRLKQLSKPKTDKKKVKGMKKIDY